VCFAGCRFCRRRFYDSAELYRHMEGEHEHCFICRWAALTRSRLFWEEAGAGA
jgi:hypothetical protein